MGSPRLSSCSPVLTALTLALAVVAAILLQSCGGSTQLLRDGADAPPPSSPPPSGSPQLAGGVFTYHYDNTRRGLNDRETTLTPGNVNPAGFGKLFHYSVDGFVYAQPLYVENVDIPGKGRFDVLYVATEHNTVYAFDAAGRERQPLWRRSFINPSAGVTTMSRHDVGSSNTGNEVGITGTPVIDARAGTLFVVAATKENGRFFQRLHALDIRTGQPRGNSPVEIRARVPGKGAAHDGSGHIVFNPLRQNQRGALALADGILYIPWGSHHRSEPWHGWVMAYDAATLQQIAVFVSTPDARRGGIWMSGNGPLIDPQGNVFVTAGDGTFSAHQGGRDYANSLIRLSRGRDGLRLMDHFTPHDQRTLDTSDLDFGTGGPILLPDQGGRRLILQVSKAGHIYLLDRENLGKHRAGDDGHAVQVVRNAVGVLPSDVTGSFAGRGAGYGTPAYWNGKVYFAGSFDVVKAYSLENGRLSTSPVSRGAQQLERRGATPVVSANGNQNGILWIVEYRGGRAAALRAYDANDLRRQLYSSLENPDRDRLDLGTKFSAPVVYKGKVFVGTEWRVTVYGLLR